MTSAPTGPVTSATPWLALQLVFASDRHGNFDLSAYDAYLSGELEDPEFSEADMEAALERLPDAPAIA